MKTAFTFFMIMAISAGHIFAQDEKGNKPDSVAATPTVINLDSLINDSPVFPREADTEVSNEDGSVIVPETEPVQQMKVIEIEEPKVVNFDDQHPEEVKTTIYRTRYDKPRKEKNREDDIQTLAGGNHHNGGFGAVSFKASNFRDESLVLMGLRGGWIVNRSIAIGFEGYGIIPTASYEDIPNFLNKRVRALGGYGGMFIEPIFFSNKVIHVTFPVSGGAGWIGYSTDWEDGFGANFGGPVDDDVFWYIEPGAALEVNVARNFRLNLGMSKRFTQDLVLINTASDAFDDWNYFVTLKIGSF